MSAAPSFFLASMEYDTLGMLAGIAIWIALLTLITHSKRFRRLARFRGATVTIYLGYGLRVLASVLLPLSFLLPLELVWNFPEALLFVDGIPGLISIQLGARLGFEGHGVLSSLVITLIQGGLLNLMVGVVMLVLYPLVWLFAGHSAGGTNP